MCANKDDEVFRKLKGTTPNYNLSVYKCRGKRYVDVTPLLVDMGIRYPNADDFRTNGGIIRDLKCQF